MPPTYDYFQGSTFLASSFEFYITILTYQEPRTNRQTLTQPTTMPHHPSEEETSSNVFDQVAKESKDSNASDHPMHAEEASQTKATASDHASKGPQIVESKS